MRVLRLKSREKLPGRGFEARLLLMVFVIATLGFLMVTAAAQVQSGSDPMPVLRTALQAPVLIGMTLLLVHMLFRLREMEGEQIILGVVSLLFVIGLILIWRLRGADGVWQQMTRGFFPGMVVVALLALRPQWVEQIRQRAVPISLVGLALLLLTGIFGAVDETGARLALKLGPLPPIQTSEIIKVALLIFLAWYIDREGAAAEGRARAVLGWLRLPAPQYVLPGAVFTAIATLALVQMSDLGAVLVLAFLFVAMLYAGFETRIFTTIAAIGLVLALLAGMVLAFTWEAPAVIRYRFMAFRDPWSTEVIMVNGQPSGVTISEGPGYQIQQSLYAIVAGGITGRGLGFGTPQYVPLSASDFIFAAVSEEMGLAVSLAVLALFAILLLRILRIAMLLPATQVFERLVVIGIGVHLFTQVFIMVGGTVNLMPMTGITVPFMSQGGMALLINLAEIGIVLAMAQRVERQPA